MSRHRMSLHPIKRPGALLLALALSLGGVACGNTVSTSNFKGESGAVAQVIKNFQSDATAADQAKLCQNDLARPVRERLKSTGGECQQALKNQLQQIDTFNLTIDSIAVTGSTATAKVISTYSGKNRLISIQLVKEGSSWRISSLS